MRLKNDSWTGGLLKNFEEICVFLDLFCFLDGLSPITSKKKTHTHTHTPCHQKMSMILGVFVEHQGTQNVLLAPHPLTIFMQGQFLSTHGQQILLLKAITSQHFAPSTDGSTSPKVMGI